MPRPLRNYLPGIPAHIVQRGVDRAPCFFSNGDRSRYLHALGIACRKYGVSLHAYVLMTNHVHLVMTPDDSTGISRAMQSLGSRYVQYLNRRKGRTGTLWEDRHHCSLIQSERYLLSCYRYAELNPVRASMTADPGDYLWSSYRANALGEWDPLVIPHETYRAIGADSTERARNYRALFELDLSADELGAIRVATQLSRPLGDDEFKSRIDAALGRPSPRAKRGRPRGRTGKSSGRSR